MALIWHLAVVTNSALIMSLASIAGMLPMAVLGSVAGAYVDRWNRKKTMIYADLYIAMVSLVLVIYTLFADLPIWAVMAVLFFRSIGSSFHTPAISAVTPLIVPETHLTKCSGYTQTVQTIGYIAGTALAAILYPLWGVSGMVLLDVAGAILASVAVLIVKIPSPPKKDPDLPSPITAGLFRGVMEGYKIIRKNRGIFAILWTGTIVSILFSPVSALFPLMSMDYFGGTTTEASVVEAVFAVGMLVGGIVLGMWGGFKNRGITLSTSVAIIGLTIGLSGILPVTGFVFFAVFSFVMDLAAPFYSGIQTALMQERIQPEYLGRVFGLYGSLLSFAMLIGFVITGAFAEMIGNPMWFLLSGIGILSLAMLMFFLPDIRKIDIKQQKME